MIAALQMYDWQTNLPDLERFWASAGRHLRERGIAAPDELDHSMAVPDPWPRDDLLVGQTCGLPLVSGRCGAALAFARPDFAFETGGEATYRSAIVCHKARQAPLGSFIGSRAAINERGSQSGCNALVDAMLDEMQSDAVPPWQASQRPDGRSTDIRQMEGEEQDADVGRGPATGPVFATLIQSGSHRASAGLVAQQRADIAAIDSVAFDLLRRQDPHVFSELVVIAWTRPMPALPYITAPSNGALVRDLCDALDKAARELAPEDLAGVPCRVVPASLTDYRPISAMAERIRNVAIAGIAV